MNREQWLTSLAKKIEPMFKGHGTVPSYRVSCSWPSRSALSTKKRRIGECWPPECSKDKTVEIMITMAEDDRAIVAAVLVHELVHAVVGNKHGHKAPFKRVAVAVGLEGKMTATTAGKELAKRLNVLMAKMPKYPHARLDRSANKNIKKQGTRLLKAICDCGYTVRVTKKWAEMGSPICPLCEVSMTMED